MKKTKREYKTIALVGMLLWRELLLQIPLFLITFPMMFFIVNSGLKQEVMFFLLTLIAVLGYAFTTKFALYRIAKKVVIQKNQINKIAIGYILCLSIIVMVINWIEYYNSIETIISLVIQLAVLYVYTRKTLGMIVSSENNSKECP